MLCLAWCLRWESCCGACLCPSHGGSQRNFLGLCRQPLSLGMQDGPADPESVLHCSQIGSCPQRAVFGTSLGADSVLRKMQHASHLSHKVSHSQRSCGSRLLSHDSFWMQQQHDMATFVTKRLDAELTWLVHPIAQHPCREEQWHLQSVPGPASHWPVLPALMP